MIVRDIMTTSLVTVAPDDTLGHAASLLRQHHFHHLPIARTISIEDAQGIQKEVLQCEGILTAQDIDLAAAVTRQNSSTNALQRPWQERIVATALQPAEIRVTPTTSVAAAAQLLVERGLSALPVVEYHQENRVILVGLLTRSDLLLALSRAMGAFEPGMQLDIALPGGDMRPLARTLLLASDLQVHIQSIMVTPRAENQPLLATLRLGTINPTPLLMRLQEEGISYSFGHTFSDNAPL